MIQAMGQRQALAGGTTVTVNTNGTLLVGVEDGLGYGGGIPAQLNIIGGLVTSADVANTIPVQSFGGTSFRLGGNYTDRSKKYFRKLSKSDLDRELDEPWFKPLPTVGIRLVSVLEDGILHAGEASYIRGLRQGKGWQKY